MAKTPDGRASMILKKWASELANKDRTINAIKGNFEELWHDMYTANIDFDTAYSKLDDAIKAHSPSKSVVKHTYKKMKAYSPFDSEKDFLDSWLGKIRAEATECFHYYYPLEEQFEEKREAPAATINGIPRAEYTKQRKYIEQFPLMTVEEIEKMGNEINNEYLKNADDDVFNFEEMLDD